MSPASSAASAGLLPRYLPVLPGGAADSGVPATPLPAPATGAALTEVAESSPEDARRALAAATRARTDGWAWAGGADRARHLLPLADALEEEVRPMALACSVTSGRPLRASEADAGAVPDLAFGAAGWADKLAWTPAGRSPVGVVTVVADWRATPSALAVAVVTALACGNAVVLRPRPAAAPLAHLLAGTAGRAGLPAGLLTVLPGSRPATDRALWAGSGAVAAWGTRAGLHALRVELAEAGAALSADPDVLGVDVVLGEVVDAGALAAAVARDGFGALHRRAGSLVLAPPGVVEDLVGRLETAADGLRMGDPLDPATDVGPLPAPELAAAAVAAVGVPAPASLPAGGWWCPPGVQRILSRRPVAPPPGPVVGLRPAATAEAVAADLARYAADAAVEVRLWGGGAASAALLARVDGVRSVTCADGADGAPGRPPGPAGALPPGDVLARLGAFRA